MPLENTENRLKIQDTLFVDGKLSVLGVSTLVGSLSVASSTNIGGDLSVAGDLSVGGRAHFIGTTVQTIVQETVEQNELIVRGEVSVSGISHFDNNMTVNGTLISSGLSTGNIIGSDISVSGAIKSASLETSNISLSGDSGVNNFTATTAKITGDLTSGSNIKGAYGFNLIQSESPSSSSDASYLKISNATSGDQVPIKTEGASQNIGLIFNPKGTGKVLIKKDSDIEGNLNIINHNNTDKGLKLGGVLITASANEINQLDGLSINSENLGYLDIDNAGVSKNGKVLTMGNDGNVTFGGSGVDGNYFKIASHNGSSGGLELGGTLVTALATDLNKLTGGSYSGNAATATALAGSVNIAGQAFDGTDNIDIALNNLSNVNTTTLQNNQILQYNGSNWVNVSTFTGNVNGNAATATKLASITSNIVQLDETQTLTTRR